MASSYENLDKITVYAAQIHSIGLPPVTLFKESVWEDTQNTIYFMNTANTNVTKTSTLEQEVRDVVRNLYKELNEMNIMISKRK